MAVLELARHEVRRLAGPGGGRNAAAAAAMVALLALAFPLLADRVPLPERDLYTVEVGPASPYAEALAADPRLRIVAPGTAEGEVALRAGERLEPGNGARGQAALGVAREAVRAWTESRLQQEQDAAAAFPLVVDLVQLPPGEAARLPAAQPPAAPAATPPPAGGGEPPPVPSPTPAGPTEPAGPTPGEPATPGDPAPTEPTAPAAPTPPAGPPGTPAGPPAPPPAPPPQAAPELAALAPDGADARAGLRPQDLELPPPGLGLLVTFAYVLPMNLVAQMASGSLLQERTRRRGLLVLAAPLSPATILAGRLLPYALLALLVAAAATILTGAGWTGFAASLPMVLLPLAIGAAVGLLARSEREVTFLLTAVMTLYAFFLFLPAVFRALPAIAYLSPVTAVLESRDGNPVPAGALLFATLPLALASTALLLLSVGLYREETLHSPQRIGAKVRQGLGRATRTIPRAVLAGVLVVPFAFAIELLAAAFLIPLSLRLLLPSFVLMVALVEEGLKLLPTRSRIESGGGRLATAAAVASGFFLGEKLALLVSVLGLGDLELGQETLALFGAGAGLLALLPLALHIGATSVGSLGVGRGRAALLASFAGAVLLHAGYDLAVLAWGMRA